RPLFYLVATLFICATLAVGLANVATKHSRAATDKPATQDVPATTIDPGHARPAVRYDHACPNGDSVSQSDSMYLERKTVLGSDVLCPPAPSNAPGTTASAAIATLTHQIYFTSVDSLYPRDITYALWTNAAAEHLGQSMPDRPVWAIMYHNVTEGIYPIGGVPPTQPGATTTTPAAPVGGGSATVAYFVDA